jgi:multisubunit Na+/H+ antiporter MnhE subunit
MILGAHIIIALSSLLTTSGLFIKPSKHLFTASYGLVTATLVSGTLLVVQAQSSLLRACVSGLVYLFIVSFGLAVARQRYAKNHVTNK